jgi:hypothetical protein
VYTSRVTMRKEGMKKKKKTMYQAYKIKYWWNKLIATIHR